MSTLIRSTSSKSLSKLSSKSHSKSPSPFSLRGEELRRFFSPVMPVTVVMPRKKSPKSPAKKQSLVALKRYKKILEKYDYK